MAPAVLVSLMGVLSVVLIYYWWARKVNAESQGQTPHVSPPEARH